MHRPSALKVISGLLLACILNYEKASAVQCWVCYEYQPSCLTHQLELIECSQYSSEGSCFSSSIEITRGGNKKTVKGCGNKAAELICLSINKRSRIGYHCNYCKGNLCNKSEVTGKSFCFLFAAFLFIVASNLYLGVM